MATSLSVQQQSTKVTAQEMTWQAGYFADSGYTYGSYPQQSPCTLFFSALLAGHRSLDLAAPFSYLDLGCGQGFNTCLMAASHPRANFVGVDFLPEHIAHAQGLAKAVGLTNVNFLEADFRDLARQRPWDWPEFDLAAAHGIASWVSTEVRSALLQVASNSLKPGGLFYLSYNTFPGWLSTVPFQHLVSSFQAQCRPGQPSLAGAIDLLAELRDAGAVTFSSYPGLQQRLDQINRQDKAYLVQEYNNRSWQPRFADQMIREAADAKLTFLSTADLPLLFDGFYPEPFRKLLRQHHADGPMRELVRDLLLNQSFRRDIYVKGMRKVWILDRLALLDAVQLVSLSPREDLEDPDAFSFGSSLGTLGVNRKLYAELMSLLGDSPQTIGQLRRALARHFGAVEDSVAPMPRVLLPVALLMNKRMVSIVPEGNLTNSSAVALNRHLAAAAAAGAPYRAVSLPHAGASYSVSREELLVLDALAAGHRDAELVGQVLKGVRSLDGIPERQPFDEDFKEKLSDHVRRFVERKLRLISRLGGWDCDQSLGLPC